MSSERRILDALIESGVRSGFIIHDEDGLLVIPLVEAFRSLQAEYAGREDTPEYAMALRELRFRFGVGKTSRS